jgi:hypothetical protein
VGHHGGSRAFRAGAAVDLVKHRYGGDAGRFKQDMRALSEAGLAERRSVARDSVRGLTSWS